MDFAIATGCEKLSTKPENLHYLLVFYLFFVMLFPWGIGTQFFSGCKLVAN
jgi:hypothetical protein